MNENQEIAEKLRKFFENNGFTQLKVAELLGTSKQYVSNVFCGRAAIGKGMAKKMENCFGLSSAWLLTGQGSMYAERNSHEEKGKADCIDRLVELERAIEVLKSENEELKSENKHLRERCEMLTDKLLSNLIKK